MNAPPADGERRTVLVVEDEYLLAMELKHALVGGGFEVLGPAGSVNHALDLVNEKRPHAAVLDLTLGSETVSPVALHLKSLGVPFILASAVSPRELARYPIFSGVLNLGKPTDLGHLVRVMQSL
ncbi:response regulator [Rhizobium grahamii]|uniref:Response regulatory domain-containing protein n=1 Tax=Rhizobium grahamii TaxID=1120045 RepID=A0A370KG51_9HYPH|nr:response regulator [Rhizobium grahamii]RDJ02703.1 hypothetical protein B5K06_31970 [Rhizobium grahamii]